MKKSIILLIVSLIVLSFLNERLVEADKKVVSYEYKGIKGQTQGTVIAKLIGAKRATTSFLWMRQVVVVGENLGDKDVDRSTKEIYNGSQRITYLDPYFEENYKFSGSILAFIKTYRRYDMAFEIFRTGIEYNPDSEMLKKYMAGVLASSKGNIIEILKIFEEIVDESRDDLLINTLAFTYEQAYEATNNKIYLHKSLYYWNMLVDSKDERYRKRAIEKLDKYKKKL